MIASGIGRGRTMPQKKIHIEKNSVQETLIVPLYGRKMCAEKFPDLYADGSAKRLCDSLDYDFSEQEAKKDTLFYEFGDFILTVGVFGIINTEMGVVGILPLIATTFNVSVPQAGWRCV